MQTEWQIYNMYLKIHHKVRIWDDIIEYRLETEGQQQKAALEAGEAAKAQLEAKLKKKEEEVLTLFILVIIITRAPHSPCSSCLCLSPGLNDGQAALQVWAGARLHEEEEEVESHLGHHDHHLYLGHHDHSINLEHLILQNDDVEGTCNYQIFNVNIYNVLLS